MICPQCNRPEHRCLCEWQTRPGLMEFHCSHCMSVRFYSILDVSKPACQECREGVLSPVYHSLRDAPYIDPDAAIREAMLIVHDSYTAFKLDTVRCICGHAGYQHYFAGDRHGAGCMFCDQLGTRCNGYKYAD